MNLDTSDWIDFCEGKRDFDKSHFYTLLAKVDYSKPIEDEDFKNLFKFFPSEAEELELRLRNCFSTSSDLDMNENLIKNYLISNVQKDIKSKGLIIEDDYNKQNLKREIKYIEDYSAIEHYLEEDAQISFFSELSDFMVTQKKYKDKKVYALFEAYYGLTNNYQMVWYLGSPLLKTKIDFDNYYNIWKLGGEYVITEDVILVSRQ